MKQKTIQQDILEHLISVFGEPNEIVQELYRDAVTDLHIPHHLSDEFQGLDYYRARVIEKAEKNICDKFATALFNSQEYERRADAFREVGEFIEREVGSKVADDEIRARLLNNFNRIKKGKKTI